MKLLNLQLFFFSFHIIETDKFRPLDTFERSPVELPPPATQLVHVGAGSQVVQDIITADLLVPVVGFSPTTPLLSSRPPTEHRLSATYLSLDVVRMCHTTSGVSSPDPRVNGARAAYLFISVNQAMVEWRHPTACRVSVRLVE